MQSLLAPIDIYCERLSEGLRAEPVNLLTNAAFILAAILLWRHTAKPRHQSVSLMTALVATIGVGSALFHSFANRWSMLADVIPIGLFLCVNVYCFTHYILRCSRQSAGLAVLAFIMANVAIKWLPEALRTNGTEVYFPTCLGLALASFLAWKRHLSYHYLLVALAVFFGSMIMRSQDMAVCEAWPVGTHFLWHILNSVVLYCVVKSYYLQRCSRP